MGWLTEELTRRGHEVTLFASGDSRTRARLVAPCAQAIRLDPARPDPLAFQTIQLAQVFARAHEFDVIHSHVDHGAFPFGRLVPTPVVHTLHGRLDLDHLVPVLREFRDVPLVSISDAQRAPLVDLRSSWVATVHHGLPVETIRFDRHSGAYLAFLGRVSPEKGLATAIAVAKRAGLPLRVAAKIDETDRASFEREIRPLLADPLIDFLGEVDDRDKYTLLGGALALLFPIDWPEPFGLVMIEALASGTPVVARPCGAVPEIVADGETGFVAGALDDLVAAVKRVDLIDRAACRRAAETRFSVGAMTDRYETVYRTVIAGHS